VGFSLACLLVGISAIAYGQNRTTAGNTLGVSQAKAIVAAQPLAFEANQGQADKSVKFLARAKGYAAFLTSNESLVRINGDTVLRMKLRNGNPSPVVNGEDLQLGKSNYLLGNDRSKWIVGVPHYSKVRAKDVYPGIDAVYSGNERQIEYDFVVNPGVDPGQIRMDFDGASDVSINRYGDLELRGNSGVMSAHKPVVYQMINGQRKAVNGDFVLLAKNEAGFRLGQYDAGQALVIDPTVIVEANVGGTNNDEGWAIAANNTGIVLTGRTQSVNTNTPDKAASGFPVLSPLPGQGQHSASAGLNWDAFVTKFSTDPITGLPVLIYSTYLGTPQDEAGTGVALDAAGNAYVTGYTNSAALLPSPLAAFTGIYDAFLVELPSSGAAITASTFFGGAGTTQAFSLAIDPVSSNIVIGGLTTGLSTAPGGFQTAYGLGTTDGFVASFAPGTLTPVASTYLGGTSYDQVNSVTVGADGGVYAVGFTASGSNAAIAGTFPTSHQLAITGTLTSGVQAAFAVKFNNATTLSALRYSSVFGVGGETANGVAADVDGVAYVVGATKAANFSSAAQPNCNAGAGNPQNGTLAAVPTSGVAIQYNAGCVSPGETQGFLLALTGPSLPGVSPSSNGGAVKYLDLQAFTANDPANLAGCNLNLTKNGGAFSSGNVCVGEVGSWNAVATDTDEEAYVAGQQGTAVGPIYEGDWYRFAPGGVLNPGSTAILALDANNGVAVINSKRQEYSIGTTTGIATGPSYLVGSPLIQAPDGLVANGGEDVSFVGIQYNDVFATPTTITLAAAAINATPAPSATVETVNAAGVAISCPVPASSNPAFTITALPSTGTYSISISTATIGVYNGTATFACGGDNGTSTIAFSGTITGNLVLAPSAPLTATTQVGSGIIQEAGSPAVFYPQPGNNNGNNPQITVDVTTAIGSIPYTVSQSVPSRSANWPTCALLNIGAPSGPATPPAGGGTSSFVIQINSNCANQLAVGTYTENIAVASTVSGLATATPLAFSLTVTSGGVLTQGLSNFIFGTSSTPQSGAFTIQAPTSSALSYQLVFTPWNNGTTPLPAQNASIVSGASGTIPPNGTAVATIQISPAGLATGVYGFCYSVTSVTLINTVPRTCAFVYVGTGLGFVTPAGGVLNVSVPAGYAPANLTQPANISLTGLSNYSASPYSITLPSGAAISFTPALPVASAFTLTGGSPCNTWAQANAGNTTIGPWCTYTATIDSTSLVAGTTYVGTVTFKGATGVSANLTVNLTATQYPQLMWVNNNGVPLPSITFNSVIGSAITLCSNNFPFPGNNFVTATGGVVPQVLATIAPTSSWMGLNGNQGFPGNLGNTNPVNFGIANPVQAPNFYFQNVCVSALNITKPGTYTGTVTATGGGVNSPAVLGVNFIVSGTGTTNVGIFRAGFEWVLDANGNTTFDGTGPGLDLVEAFGGIAGDVPITGDWSATGTTKIGIYRASNGLFILDYNDNGTFDGCLIDRCYQFMPTPTAGDIPVAGDWTGTGNAKVGIYRPSTGQWFLDTNGDGIFESGVDVVTNYGGLAGDVPVTGDWTGSGSTKIGIFRAGFFWILNTTGTGTYSAADAAFPFGGIAGDVSVVGDWNASGTTKVGVFRLGFFWVLDTNGDHLFTLGPDQAFPFGGLAGDVPVVGKWRKP